MSTRSCSPPRTSTRPAPCSPANGGALYSPGSGGATPSPSKTTTTPSTATTARPSAPSKGLDPDRIIYAGSASKTLAPALRLGWLVVPARLVPAVTDHKDLADCGTAGIEQHAFARFLSRGELDRHLRRMRVQYRRRRDLLLQALAGALPEATVRGIAAGLHATVELPDGYDEKAILQQARRRGIDLMTTHDFWIPAGSGRPTLLLGYAQIPLPAIREAIQNVADAVRSTRQG